MYVDTSTLKRSGKSYTRHLIRDSYRQNGKVRHRTIANISHCATKEIDAIKLALKHKSDLTHLGSLKGEVKTHQGPSVGATWTIFETAKKLGIVQALGNTEQGKLALWQVLSRVIDQGSRLSAVRLAGNHAACDILGLGKFNEDHLYANLDWLAKNQGRIENRLIKQRYPESSPDLFLYDVTSSYLEGTENELAMFGYNRDGKRGKKQIVIGLLCDKQGEPISIEVFEGNTQDPKTFASQIKKVAERFGGGEVTFVGDRGMIKSREIKDILDHSFHFITAITKAQIETLMKKNIFEMSLFDQTLAEVETEDAIRYVLRRNPVRAEEMEKIREDKIQSILKLIDIKNEYLTLHPRAKPETAIKNLSARIKRLKITWVQVETKDRQLYLKQDSDLLASASKFDGCYVLKTDLQKEVCDKETVHTRYKDLALVESAFRNCKTVHLETRPIYVRLEERTRGHVFVVMLAYKIIRHLAECWASQNMTVAEGIAELRQLCATNVSIRGDVSYNSIPEPRPAVTKLLQLAKVTMPTAIPSTGIRVSTKKKLPENRRNA